MDFERQTTADRREGERASQFSAGGMKIGSAVGRQPALNSINDQIAIIELLARIPPADGGPTVPLYDPKFPGQADSALVNAILAFQRAMASKGLISPLYCDGRVDAGGKTLALLNRFAGAGAPNPIQPKANGSLAWLTDLARRLSPHPINWNYKNNTNYGGSVGPVGITWGTLELEPTMPRGPIEKLEFTGGGFQVGPSMMPNFGAELPAPAELPSYGSQLHRGLRSTKNHFSLDDLLGNCVIVSLTAAVNYGVSGSITMFNVGSNRQLEYLPGDIIRSLGGAGSFVNDSFDTCQAWACSASALAGLSVGFGVVGVKLARTRSLNNLFNRY